MIKKWNNFILESVSDKDLSNLKDKSDNFIGEDEMNSLLNDDTLWNIFEQEESKDYFGIVLGFVRVS